MPGHPESVSPVGQPSPHTPIIGLGTPPGPTELQPPLVLHLGVACSRPAGYQKLNPHGPCRSRRRDRGRPTPTNYTRRTVGVPESPNTPTRIQCPSWNPVINSQRYGHPSDHRPIPLEPLSTQMADDNRSRTNQARDADRRQRQRAIAAELERGNEPEPPLDPADLAAAEATLKPLEFPVTGSDIIAHIGDHELEATTGTYTVEDLFSKTDTVTFDSPIDVRRRIQQPTVATTMKRIEDASDHLPDADPWDSQQNAYVKTFRALKAIDQTDDDTGIQVIRDWIIEQIETEDKLPSSRDVRREAAKYCRTNGYAVRNDDWLGI